MPPRRSPLRSRQRSAILSVLRSAKGSATVGHISRFVPWSLRTVRSIVNELASENVVSIDGAARDRVTLRQLEMPDA